jgi:hypothetical protein
MSSCGIATLAKNRSFWRISVPCRRPQMTDFPEAVIGRPAAFTNNLRERNKARRTDKSSKRRPDNIETWS